MNMENKSRKGLPGDTKKLLEYINKTIKVELQNEAQGSGNPVEYCEFQPTSKVENCSGGNDSNLEANTVESEFVKFVNTDAPDAFKQIPEQTVTLEKIPKNETLILDSELPLYSDLYSNDMHSDTDSNSDPERDPFADIECDPSFSQKPKSRITHSSNSQPSSAKRILPATKATQRRRKPKEIEETNLRCQLCFERRDSAMKLRTHLEVCAASHKNRRRFCVDCNFLYRSPQGYQKHALNIHGIQEDKLGRYPLQCKLCPSSFLRNEFLIEHAKFCHDINLADVNDSSNLASKLECKLCLETQNSESELKTHLEICATSHKDRRSFCVLCNRLFCYPQGYRKHAFKIHGIKQESIPTGYPFKCQICVCSFALEESFLAHFASKHETSTTTDDHNLKLKPFPCLHCTLRFKSPSALKLHITSHLSDRPFKCPVPNCGKAFKFKHNLDCHRQNVHSEERPFKCQEPDCSKAFKTERDLERHQFCHSVERPLKCPHADCDLTFKSKEAVGKHLLVHAGTRRYTHITDRPFKCAECDRAFCKNWQLTKHIKLVHPKNKELFKCPEPNCETTFKYQNNLNVHFANFHTGGEQVTFTCPAPNCSKSYKTKRCLVSHVATHTLHLKCTEPGCSAAFARPSFLNSHMKSKHKKGKIEKIL